MHRHTVTGPNRPGRPRRLSLTSAGADIEPDQPSLVRLRHLESFVNG